MVRFSVNGKDVEVSVAENKPLLYFGKTWRCQAQSLVAGKDSAEPARFT